MKPMKDSPAKRSFSHRDTEYTEENQGGTQDCSAANAKDIDSLRDTIEPLCLCGKSGSLFGGVMKPMKPIKLTRQPSAISAQSADTCRQSCLDERVWGQANVILHQEAE